ncbi:MAG: hypothetical protein HY647_00630 [Acidobacteria bacterium]|nr:hypothetical protein [Acidobacteriota bacterium]
MLGYLFLVLLFLALLSLSFYFGVREWLRPEDNSPLPVDVEYVRQENFFGLSFRARLGEKLQTDSPAPRSDPGQSPIGAVLESPDGNNIRVWASSSVGEGQEFQEMIYCPSDLELAARVLCHQEIYCRGHFVSGSGAQLRAVAADGDADLGAENFVAGWVDAQGSIRLQQSTTVQGRVTSREAIAMAPWVTAQYLHAPLIFTSGYSRASDAPEKQRQAPRLALHLWGQDEAEQPPPPYLCGLHCTRLAVDTWLVRGPLKLPAGTNVDCKLVVQGALHTESDCLFASDVKGAQVKLGPRNQVQGNLISGGSLEIAAAGVVGENVVAQGDILLRAGVRVGSLRRLAAVTAGGAVTMEQNVAVHGKLIAGRAVVTL